ncbi:23S rRNA (pseudouridine(1915)-N(3))-methyltransferase RlmH [Rothia sp. SD9660Na]|uniref:23S rRNA (pseudouridine(1915)-N(3))-methyltransferase RlmH n=1 Tax=Rothia sp. SD9660Na TaxID=3047030 RepID=UPI0024BBBEE8|nr:23S rRNA (pseudouridine(1915)-N(3))-methyltransferase RlmH [Rothia sp. SD9660Na]WHS51366.1 23S rRNA (pseudouridine(1915)-N(3))-methyltransferase RlmH [Rothia sp. SD9660Na]
MTIKIIAIGKKHEKWVKDGIDRYETRLRKPWDITWQYLPHSSLAEEAARAEESRRILEKVDRDDYLVLLDERGKMLSSPALARLLEAQLGFRKVVLVIGGAYGVDDSVRARANTIWSLSDLVFPHQLVRLIITEQIYRAGEISAGRPYHHV